VARWADVPIEVIVEMSEESLRVLKEAIDGLDPWIVEDRRAG